MRRRRPRARSSTSRAARRSTRPRGGTTSSRRGPRRRRRRGSSWSGCTGTKGSATHRPTSSSLRGGSWCGMWRAWRWCTTPPRTASVTSSGTPTTSPPSQCTRGGRLWPPGRWASCPRCTCGTPPRVRRSRASSSPRATAALPRSPSTRRAISWWLWPRTTSTRCTSGTGSWATCWAPGRDTTESPRRYSGWCGTTSARATSS
mmetsp:Transcript_15696/g.49316  ORF Transcript_15696/g.49316 Transcript_15696/m.49316 type:complete len:203 (+) Transcript_15696:633-1241(+)